MVLLAIFILNILFLIPRKKWLIWFDPPALLSGAGVLNQQQSGQHETNNTNQKEPVWLHLHELCGL